jgi:two-component system phosphate regulon response regulator PhoB
MGESGSNRVAWNVVVVEDDEVGRGLLCAALEDAGLRVRSAGDVEGAEQLIAERVPEVVITDLHLPGSDGGVELARRLRSVAASAEVGIVAISGAVEPEWPVVRHFDAYLRKPIDLDLLIALVKRLASHARPLGAEATEQDERGRQSA